MKLGIMQPYFFPYIGYYQLINAVDKFVVYDDVNYINKGWINRNNILVNGKPFLFTIPLKDASQNRLIREVELTENGNWKSKLIKTIDQAYKKAIYFNPIFSLINDVLNSSSANISRLAFMSLRGVADYLDLNVEFVDTSAVYNNKDLKAQQRILDICRQERTNHYVNPIGGMEIYSKELFEQSGIRLNFIKPKHFRYKQFSDEFVPHLSMIDVLMFNSKEETKNLLSLYELV